MSICFDINTPTLVSPPAAATTTKKKLADPIRMNLLTQTLKALRKRILLWIYFFFWYNVDQCLH